MYGELRKHKVQRKRRKCRDKTTEEEEKRGSRNTGEMTNRGSF